MDDSVNVLDERWKMTFDDLVPKIPEFTLSITLAIPVCNGGRGVICRGMLIGRGAWYGKCKCDSILHSRHLWFNKWSLILFVNSRLLMLRHLSFASTTRMEIISLTQRLWWPSPFDNNVPNLRHYHRIWQMWTLTFNAHIILVSVL